MRIRVANAYWINVSIHHSGAHVVGVGIVAAVVAKEAGNAATATCIKAVSTLQSPARVHFQKRAQSRGVLLQWS